MNPLSVCVVLALSIVRVATFPAGSGVEPGDIGNIHSSPPSNTKTDSIGPGAHLFKMTRFGSLLLVPADMDIVDQTKIFTKLDPYHQQFIPTPSVNAGSLPLSSSFG